MDELRKRRIGRFQRESDAYQPLPALTEAVLFLRGVQSRAWIALTNFYLLLGSGEQLTRTRAKDYPELVFTHAVDFASKSAVTLCCRKVFDDSRSGMTGKKFGRSSDEILDKVAEHWSTGSNYSRHEAKCALVILRNVFRECSRSKKDLLVAPSKLAFRVGLLRRYADAQAAHLSMDEYEFDTLDCAHVVAALTLIGALVVRYDDSSKASDYYDEVDKAGWAAADRLFPSMKVHRLFDLMDIGQQVAAFHEMTPEEALDVLVDRLPHILEWD